MTEVPQRSAVEQTIDEILKRIERAAQAGPEDLEQLDTDLRKLVENRVRLPFGLNIRGRFSRDVARLVQQIIESIYVHTGRRVVMTLTDEHADAVTHGSPHDTATGRTSTRRSSQRRHWPRPLKLRLYDLFEALYDDLLNTIVPALRGALNDVPALAELVKEMGSPIPTMLALGLSAARDSEYTANTTVLPPREHFESKLAGDIEALVDALWDKIQSSIHAALMNRRGRTQHAATMAHGRPGVMHGSYSYLLQDDHGQVVKTSSISAGLDYPGIGPEHAFLHAIGRVQYVPVTDQQALDAVREVCRSEGILPAIEPSHAVAAAKAWAKANPGATLLINLCGRGDKDMPILMKNLA